VILPQIGGFGIIEAGIFSNEISSATLGPIWSHGAELTSFLVDIVECAKCYARQLPLDEAMAKIIHMGKAMNSTSPNQ
jgi:hypothetical protein